MKTNKNKSVVVQVLFMGKVEETYSFNDTKEGNLEAERKFIELMNTKIWNIEEYTQEDIDNCLDDGYAKYGNNMIVINHSL